MKIQRFGLAIATAITIAAFPALAEELSGVRNFHVLNETVSRGAQPSDEGFAALAKRGVKTVIDLRRPTEHAVDAERKVVEALGMRYVNVPMEGVVAPTEASMTKVQAILNDPSAGPVFVHCKRGADRTGAVIACYRMNHDKWNNAKAYDEARNNGMSWTQFGIKSWVRGYKVAPAAAEATAGADAEAVAASASTNVK